MSAILMAPQTIPSRFSLPEEAGPTPSALPPAPRLGGLLAAMTGRLRRIAASPPAPRSHTSSAAAW